MKNTLNSLINRNLIISLCISLVGGILIWLGASHITLDMGLHGLLPYNSTMTEALALSQHSDISEKVIIYIDKSDEQKFERMLDFIKAALDNLPITLHNAIPDSEDILQIMRYFETNNLLLYPYDVLPSPFDAEHVRSGLNAKMTYLENMPMMMPDEAFFADPLMSGLQALNYANAMTTTEYMPQYGGVVSPDGTAYIMILSAGFGTEAYDKIANLVTFDKMITRYAKQNDITAFVYSPHLYFWDSMTHIKTEVTLIFILSVALTFLIFFVFYRNIVILLYVFMPIVVSFGLTFISLALFRGRFGAIALAFGATTAGITIDYSIHYISKVNMYGSLSELRRKIALPMFFGYLTTVCSFAFLFLSGITSLSEIALFGILAVTFSYLMSAFVMQPLLSPGRVNIPMKTLLFPKPGITGLVIWSVLFVMMLLGVVFTKFEDNVMMMDMRHKTLESRIAVIQQHFAESTDSVFIVFSGDTTDDVMNVNYKASLILKQHGLSLNTPALFCPSSSMLADRRAFVRRHFDEMLFAEEVSRSDFEPDAFDAYRFAAKHIDEATLTPMPDFLSRHIMSQFFTYNGQVRLMIHIPDVNTLRAIDNLLTENDIPHTAVAVAADSADGLVTFERNAMKYIFLSLILVTLILICYFRSPLYGILAATPMLCALMASYGIAFWTGRGFNILHFAAGIVVLGIGVDYGIYIVDAYRHKYSSAEINATLQSMFISGLTTLSGFGVLAISSNRSVFSLGSSTFAGIVSAFITAYFFTSYVCEKISKTDKHSDEA